MAQRAQRTVNPDRISNIDDWLRSYKQKYANLVVRESDGALLVLGPSEMDRESPVKTFTLTKAVDAISATIGNTEAVTAATAGAHLSAATKARHEATTAADAAYRTAEKQMLEAVVMWRTSDSPAARTSAALEVGRLQRELQTLDERRQEARYPQRFIQSVNLPRMVINYDTRDERLIPHPVFHSIQATTNVAERTIPV
jgi:hypothetical protein